MALDFSRYDNKQLAALTGQKIKKPKPADLVYAEADKYGAAVPGMAKTAMEQRQFEENLKMEEEQADAAATQGKIGLGIQGVQTALPIADKAGLLGKVFGPSASIVSGTSTAGAAGIDAAAQIGAKGAMPLIQAGGEGGLGVAGIGGSVNAGATGIGASSIMNTGLGTAVGAGLGGAAGSILGGVVGRKYGPVPGGLLGAAAGYAGAGLGAGIASGALAGSSFAPGPGTIIGGVLGALSGVLGGSSKGGCMIITACTDPNSYEVNVARIFRDDYMNPVAVKGYYVFAPVAAWALRLCPFLRRWTKRHIVDRLVRVGAFILSLDYDLKPAETPSTKDWIVTRRFLDVCAWLGYGTMRQEAK